MIVKRLSRQARYGLASGILPVLIIGLLLTSCAGGSAPSNGDSTLQDILNKSLAYVKSHHADAARYLTDNITFSQSSSTGKKTLGYTGAIFTGGGWTIGIGHAVVPDYSWEINADLNNGQIVWVGSSKNGQIGEVSYTGQ
jgi:hypothetical protein